VTDSGVPVFALSLPRFGHRRGVEGERDGRGGRVERRAGEQLVEHQRVLERPERVGVAELVTGLQPECDLEQRQRERQHRQLGDDFRFGDNGIERVGHDRVQHRQLERVRG
jgi:hypothetical protein